METEIYVGILRAICVEGQTVLRVDGAITIDCSRVLTYDLLLRDVKQIEVVEVPRMCAITLDAESGKQPGKSGDSSNLAQADQPLFQHKAIHLKPSSTVLLGRYYPSDHLKRASCSGSVDSELTCAAIVARDPRLQACHQANRPYSMAGIAVLPQELLDTILQYVDMKTLLFAQQVSRHWRDTITSSPQLQESLFLRPKTSNIVKHACDWKGNELVCFGPIPEDQPPHRPPLPSSRQTFTSITINPLLANEIYYQSLDSEPKRRGQRLVLPPLGAFLRHPSGSWRSMFLTQPPTPSVVAVSIDTSHRYGLRADITFVEANCALGSLVDKMLAAEDVDANSYAATLCLWHVMYVDTLETEYLAVGDWIAKYVDGKLVPTPAKYSAFALERLTHPLPPIFSSWPAHIAA